MDFLPSPTKGKVVAKFEPKAIPGIFVGYFLHPGAIWRGEFLCCPLSAFAEGGVAHTAGERFKPQRVKEVYFDKKESVTFPMKEAYEKRRREIAVKPIEDEELIEQLPPPEPEVEIEIPPRGERQADQPEGALPDEFDNVSDSDSDGEEGMSVFGDRKVRKYAGSSKPRNILPELWKRSSAKQKAHAIAEYARLKLAKKAKKATVRDERNASATGQTTWRRCDSAATVFVTTTADGPKWEWVTRRITRDRSDGRVIEDLEINPDISQEVLCRPIPKGPKDVETTLFFVNPTVAVPAAPLLVSDFVVPAMPLIQGKSWNHRPKIPREFFPLFAACVARPVSKAEVKANEKANASLLKEWDSGTNCVKHGPGTKAESRTGRLW